MYTEAERLGELAPKTLAWARVVGAHERAHVRAIQGLLGRQAVRSPGFNYGSVTSDEQAFLKTAVAFEDLAVAAYKGQAPRIDSNSILAVAVSIHSVEARHAAWISDLAGRDPAPRAADPGASAAEVVAALNRTGFIKR
jgi:hypothetical protein